MKENEVVKAHIGLENKEIVVLLKALMLYKRVLKLMGSKEDLKELVIKFKTYEWRTK
jgi:hypothetical protein